MQIKVADPTFSNAYPGANSTEASSGKGLGRLALSGVKSELKLDQSSTTASSNANLSNSDSSPTDAKFFVGGFNSEVTESDLRSHFSQFGTILEIKLMRDSSTGRGRGFGFVTMSDISSRPLIMNQPEHIICGRKASVRPYNDQIDMKDSFTDGPILQRKVFVGGINPALGQDTLELYFSKFGPIEDATIMRYPDGRSRGFGFVIFRDDASCQQALHQRNHQLTSRDRVEVKRCLSRGVARPSSSPNGYYGPPLGYGIGPGMYSSAYGGSGYGGGYGSGYGGGGYGPPAWQDYRGDWGPSYDSYNYYGWGYNAPPVAGPGVYGGGLVSRGSQGGLSPPGPSSGMPGREPYYDPAVSGRGPYGSAPIMLGARRCPPGGGAMPPNYNSLRRGGGFGRGGRPGPY